MNFPSSNYQTPLPEKSPYLELFWSVFSVFGLNTERYSVSIRMRPNAGKSGPE